MKASRLALGLVGFVAAAAGIGYLAKSRIPQTKAINLIIKNCQFAHDQELKIAKDQNVSLRVTSDQVGEFKIQGYDLTRSLQSGQNESFNFRAVRSGIFDLELGGCSQHALLVVLNEDGSEASIQEHEQSQQHQEAEHAPSNQTPSSSHDEAEPH